MKKYFRSLIALILAIIPVYASVPLSMGSDTNFEFPFDVLPHVYDEGARRFFLASNQEIDQDDYKKYAISFLASESELRGITQEKAIINEKKDQPNPLFGAKINQISMLDRRPMVVAAKEPSSIYLFDGYGGIDQNKNDIPPTLTRIAGLTDAEGNRAEEVVALTSNAPAHIASYPESRYRENESGTAIYAAVKKAGVPFGKKGSGIALIGMYFHEIQLPKKDDDQAQNKDRKPETATIRIIEVQDAQIDSTIKTEESFPASSSGENEAGQVAPGENTEKKEVKVRPRRAAALDGETPEVYINNPAELYESINLFSCRYLGLYAGLHGKSGQHEADGIRSLILAKVTQQRKLEFLEIAPATALSSDDKIVGAVGANKEVCVHKLSSMVTSSWLDYLVVVGGNGPAASTVDQVYALPLVGYRNKKKMGTIAKKDSLPELVSQGTTPKFYMRNFIEPAEKPEDMPTSADEATRVGGGPLGMPVTDVFSIADTVYVSAAQPGNGQQPGIFYSQAILDEHGKVASWTPWARAGAVGNIHGFAFDAGISNFIYLTGQDSNVARNAFRTHFGRVGLSDMIEEEFPKENGGVQAVDEFDYATPGFSSIPGARLSLFAWTGNKKLVLTQAGADDEEGNFGPIESGQAFDCVNGSLKGFVPKDTVNRLNFTGGDLDKLGPIISTAFCVSSEDGYFVVGGFGGIAILSDSFGKGFNAINGLQSNFAGLDESLEFRKMKFDGRVRKLMAQDEFLYIMTEKNLFRAELTRDLIRNSEIKITCLTGGSSIPGFSMNDSIADGVVSNGFAVIASSAGVYYAHQADKAGDSDLVKWQKINLNDGFRSSTKLLALGSKNGFDDKGMIYILNAFIGTSQSKIFRIAVDGSNMLNPVKNINDMYLMSKGATNLINLGGYKNYMATDGATFYTMRSKVSGGDILFERFTHVLRSGLSRGERRLLPQNIEIENASKIGPMFRSKTTGQWLVIGDFGLRGNG